MKEVKAYFRQLFLDLTGNLVTIGLKDQKLIDIAIHNKKIENFTYLNSDIDKSKGRKKFFSYQKKIGIRKFRKTFKKKKIDCLVCHFDEVQNQLKYFVKDSIYICRKDIYYYGKLRKKDLFLLQQKYQRYRVTMEEITYGDYTILKIHVGNAKTYRIKEFFYFISDSVANGIDLLGDYLVN